MVYKDQIPWFATSNGMIDLQTSADFRDHRYTNNEIVNNNINTTENSTDSMAGLSYSEAPSLPSFRHHMMVLPWPWISPLRRRRF